MIYGICGLIGSGKSFYQLKLAVDLAERQRRKLVFNFPVDFRELKRYASMRRYPWVVWLCDNGQVAVRSAARNLSDFLKFSNSVICLDEAGLFLNARAFRDTPVDFLRDLAQSRKFGSDLIYTAQFDSQVDRQFRLLTNFFVHCQGLSRFDKKLRRPRLHWKSYLYFDADSYFSWLESSARRSFLKSYFFYAFHFELGFLTAADRQLFRVFDSFSRLDSDFEDRDFSSSLALSSASDRSRFLSRLSSLDSAIRQNPYCALGLPVSDWLFWLRYRSHLVGEPLRR